MFQMTVTGRTLIFQVTCRTVMLQVTVTGRTVMFEVINLKGYILSPNLEKATQLIKQVLVG